ncbi:polysaccharide pyruvyl transferase family protein [Aureliella helgolandensis]|uniref:Polysaccharide pyruvyl transferase n=1 Tax=Aureliella helgolandensis TaxID=2527968 RepID=A0A518G856_9BACT|nr:polysaccharide pyruvyl transferase family protein [Aureliella helgolandensis]QDV24763.1 Polysaccharide pyruvyl transferase [Aureliella helgolandensis]
MQRRNFVKAGLVGTLVAGASGQLRRSLGSTAGPPKILLRSSWQTVNIGDIAHTPGVLKLLETYLPEAQVFLWPSKLDNGVDQILQRAFPKVTLVEGAEALSSAFDACDFLLHGSGPSLVAEKDVRRWHSETGKPFGVYGITLPPTPSSSTVALTDEVMQRTIDLLGEADFVFFRDSKSLELAIAKGCRSPTMEFGPDGAFACDLRDEQAADDFLTTHQLETGKFLCCIPRLRYTPYWTIPSKNRAPDPVKQARNDAMKEHDHAQLRTAIIEVVRNTDLKVLVCPEDQTQMRVGKELLLEKLPQDVRSRVAWREHYWLTGEAVSTYVRSAGLFGNEMHSPIMCIGHGIPAIVCRWAEQTSKGYMWQDIGLQEWLFNMDDEQDVQKIVPAVMELALQPAAAQAEAKRAQAFVQQRQQETMGVLAARLA